ncbi:nuclear transcription factor Y subunit B-11-like [Phragmites australis]|uniref:nuclear transcription factor Y subunit B-11-like n=1 Tax=Phragmites australis TaxID=29695 RepID=UPI002D77E93E|nr:nuclear transcription factor Y subunit B-11-like [Phragmites australis]
MKSRKGYGQQGHLLSPVGNPPSDNESGAAAAAAASGCGSSAGYGCGGGGDSPAKEQDRFLPIANVSRIMKRSLPANAKISKEAKETVQECVSEFISFVTGEASDKCQREKRKTVNGDDLLWAMTTLGFEAYVGPLKSYLNRFREAEGEKAAVLGAGGRHGDGAADDVVAHGGGPLPAGALAPPGAGDRVGSAVHDGGDAGGHDAHVGLMMGVSVGFSAGGGTSYYTAAAGGGKAYGGEGSKVVEFDAIGGEEENGHGGVQRGFGGHLHGAVQW